MKTGGWRVTWWGTLSAHMGGSVFYIALRLFHPQPQISECHLVTFH